MFDDSTVGSKMRALCCSGKLCFCVDWGSYTDMESQQRQPVGWEIGLRFFYCFLARAGVEGVLVNMHLLTYIV